MLLKSKDALKVIEAKHSRDVLAQDEALWEITVNSIVGVIWHWKPRPFPLKFQILFGILGSRYLLFFLEELLAASQFTF